MIKKRAHSSNSWLRIRKSCGAESGAAMMEFVISFLPFFIVLSGAFGIMQLAYVFGTVEYMANEAAQLATLPGTTNGFACAQGGTDEDSSRHCRVYNRIRKLAPKNSNVYITSTSAAPCTRPPSDSAHQILAMDGTATNPNIDFGTARQLISVCVSVQVSAMPFNLLPIPVFVSGIAIGRNEPNV